MTKPQNNEQWIVDQLADFTDSILSETTLDQDEATFASDSHLRALEQTAQSLKTAFAGSEPDEAAIQKMYNNIIVKWRKQEKVISESVWQKLTRTFNPPQQKWASQQSRRRFSIVASLATLVVLLLLTIPTLNISGTGLAGASGRNPSIFVLIAFVGLILVAMWLFRRRP